MEQLRKEEHLGAFAELLSRRQVLGRATTLGLGGLVLTVPDVVTQRERLTLVFRQLVHQLVNAMDDICDLIQDTSESLSLYDVKAITPDAAWLADIGVKCAERVKDVVELLGPQQGKFEAILKTCEEIDRLESDADRVMRSAVSKLFREEKDVREVIKMHAIYQLLESITDRCLDVANLAEGISLENS